MAPDASCGPHDFCADFEQPAPEDGWTTKHVTGGALDVATNAGWPGIALGSAVTAQGAPQNYAYLTKDFAAAAGIHLEVEINIPAVQLDPNTVLTLVQFSGAA